MLLVTQPADTPPVETCRRIPKGSLSATMNRRSRLTIAMTLCLVTRAKRAMAEGRQRQMRRENDESPCGKRGQAEGLEVGGSLLCSGRHPLTNCIALVGRRRPLTKRPRCPPLALEKASDGRSRPFSVPALMASIQLNSPCAQQRRSRHRSRPATGRQRPTNVPVRTKFIAKQARRRILCSGAAGGWRAPHGCAQCSSVPSSCDHFTARLWIKKFSGFAFEARATECEDEIRTRYLLTHAHNAMWRCRPPLNSRKRNVPDLAAYSGCIVIVLRQGPRSQTVLAAGSGAKIAFVLAFVLRCHAVRSSMGLLPPLACPRVGGADPLRASRDIARSCPSLSAHPPASSDKGNEDARRTSGKRASLESRRSTAAQMWSLR